MNPNANDLTRVAHGSLSTSQPPVASSHTGAETSSWLESLCRMFAWPLIAVVRVYQKLISPAMPLIGVGCRFYPTCSHYSIEALRTHGAARGLWLTLVRLAKCTPLHPGGVDLVPPRRPRDTLRCVAVFTTRASDSRIIHHTLSLHG